MFEVSPLSRAAFVALIVGILAFGSTSRSIAAVPASIHYQAYLTNADGSPVSGDVEITFSAYFSAEGGAPLWNQTTSVTAVQGLVTVALGSDANPFPEDLWDNAVFIGLMIGGEALLPRRALTTHAYAFRAQDADTLQGATPEELDQSAAVEALDGQVSALSGDVETLNTSVQSVDARLADVEATAADITGITAGQGLVGGASAGEVTISISNGAVTNAMIANSAVRASAIAANAVGASEIASGAVGTPELANDAVLSQNIAPGAVQTQDIQAAAVTGSAIADGAVSPSHLDPDEQFELKGLVVGELGLAVVSPFDTFIVSDDSAFRWFDTNADPLVSLAVSDPEMVLSHQSQSRAVIRSNAVGVALAGAEPAIEYAVSVPSLKVEGRMDIGYEIVESFFPAINASADCSIFTDGECWTGNDTASCPPGKRAIGGGVDFNTRRASGSSRPVAEGWDCEVSSDRIEAVRCYAVCVAVD